MIDLPDGWTAAILDDLIAGDGLFSDGDWVNSKDQDPQGRIRLLQLADVGDGVFRDKSSRFVNDEQFERLRCTEIFESDVLIARMPDPLGRACLVPSLEQRSITVVDVAIVRPGPSSVHPGWLMHALNTASTRSRIEMESSGTTRRRITRKKLAKLDLPVPPLNEQRRIADKLDTALAQVNTCRKHLDRVPAILKRFRQSVLAAASSGKLTEDWRRERDSSLEPWGESTIGDVVLDVRYGTSRKCEYEPKATAVLRIPNVVTGEIDHSDMKYAAFDEAEIEKWRLVPGDILVVRSNGSLGLVGTAAIASKDESHCLFAGYLIRLRIQQAAADPRYILTCLRSPPTRRDIELVARSTSGVNNINKPEIKALRIPLPSLEEQVEIARRVDTLLKYADDISARCCDAKAVTERLAPALLAKAFRGELVPQDPNDEPASVLLERIRAERAEQPKKKPGRKARGKTTPQTSRKGAAMTKSRQDEDVKEKPYLASILREAGREVQAEDLFRQADLPLVEFYKQLAWEVANGHIRDDESRLEVA